MTNPRPTILVVDDEPGIVTLLQTWLETIGCQVVSASDGEKGLEKARDVCPDLIVMDGMMPRMSGFDACKALKSDDRTRGIPLLFLTVQGEVQDVVRGLELGADGYMTKPFRPRELLARVQALLKQRTEASVPSWLSQAGSTLPAALLVCEVKDQPELVYANSELLRLLDLREDSLFELDQLFFEAVDEKRPDPRDATPAECRGTYRVRYGSDAPRALLCQVSARTVKERGRRLRHVVLLECGHTTTPRGGV